MMKRLSVALSTLLLLAAAPAISQNVGTIDVEQAVISLKSISHDDALEGIWFYDTDRATVSIERSQLDARQRSYIIRAIDVPDCSIAPGTIVGQISESAVNGTFNVVFFESETDKSTTNHCVASLAENNAAMQFRRPDVNIRVRFNVSRILPSLFRALSIGVEPKGVELPFGMRKIYPSSYHRSPLDLRCL